MVSEGFPTILGQCLECLCLIFHTKPELFNMVKLWFHRYVEHWKIFWHQHSPKIYGPSLNRDITTSMIVDLTMGSMIKTPDQRPDLSGVGTSSRLALLGALASGEGTGTGPDEVEGA